MATIDSKVVEARFDNRGFQKGVGETLTSVAQLEKGLKFDGATKGLANVSAAAQGLGNKGLAEGLGGGISTVAAKFSAMQVVAVTALATIAHKATAVALNMAKQFTIALPREGFAEYELKLGSIQTIMAGSGEDLKTVNQKLDELNTYADKTIYSFADMTQNIGKFTNAGVSLDDSVAAIQGVANVAAVSGANSNEASRAMYNFAQALSKGHVQLIDWKSIELANMGTVEFKQQLIDAAEATGSLTKQGDKWVTSAGTSVTATQGFNESLTDQWLTTEVLTGTLSDYADETTKIGKKAFAAAQDVKTFTQLIDTVKEAIGSGWAQTFEILIGNFDEAKELFTDINDVISTWVGNSADARNKVLGDWKELGGRTYLIESISAIFRTIGEVVGTVKDAFRDIFPAATGRSLYLLTTQLYNFAQGFKMGEESLENFKRTMRGFFAIFGIGFEVLKAVGGFLADIWGQLFEGSGAVLEVTGNMGDFLVKIHDTIKNGEGLTNFFDNLSEKIEPVIDGIRDAVKWLGDLVNLPPLDADKLAGGLDKIRTIGDDVSLAWEKVVETFERVRERLRPLTEGIVDFFSGIPDKIKSVFEGIEYSDILSTINTGLFAGLLVLIKDFISGKEAKDAKPGLLDTVKESISGITETFGALTDTLSTMQNTLRAATLLQIAAAVALMAYAMVKVSEVEADDVVRSLGAMAGLIGELMAAMVLMQVIGGPKGLFTSALGLTVLAKAIDILAGVVMEMSQFSWEDLQKGLQSTALLLAMVITTSMLMQANKGGMISSAVALVIMAGAIKALTYSVASLSGMSWEELQKGIGSVAALLGAIALFTLISSANGAGIRTGAGLILISVAIRGLYESVKKFAEMSIGDLQKGLGTVGAILLGFAIFTQVANPSGMIRTGAALVIVSGALYILSSVLHRFSNLSWEEIGRGLTAMAAALAAVAVTLSLMPPSTLLSAVALGIASVALIALAEAMKSLGGMTWGEIGKGITVLAGALTVLALGMTAMALALPGAVAMIFATAALALFVPVLQTIGTMDINVIVQGLVALAGVFLVLAAAGYLLAPTIPTFIGLAASFLIFGAGVALVGVGLGFLAKGLQIIAETGAAAAAVLGPLLVTMIEAIPDLARGIAEGFVAFLEVLSTSMDAILAFVVEVLQMILQAIRDVTPDIIDTMITLTLELLGALRRIVPQIASAALAIMLAILRKAREYVPQIVREIVGLIVDILGELRRAVPKIVVAAVNLMVAFLRGIANNIGRVIRAATDVIIAFIEGIGKNALRIINAAAETILTFIEGLTKAVNRYAGRFRTAGKDLAFAIVDGITGGLASKVSSVIEGARSLASSAIEGAKNFFGIDSPSKVFMEMGGYVGDGLAIGLVKSAPVVEKASVVAGTAAVNGMRKTLANVNDLINMDLDLNPKITPVIDMTEIRKGAAQIDKALASKIAVDSAYSTAAQVSRDYQSVLDNQNGSESEMISTGNTITYIQNNTSPKALSEVEIYRQTNNQLSMTKGALNK